MPDPVYTAAPHSRQTPPRPNQARQQFSATARAILYGEWDTILQHAVRDRVGTQRRKAWQDVDLSANVYRVAASGLSALYDEPGEVIHEDAVAAKFMADLLEQSEWWPYMQRVQRDTWALRELHVGVSWDDVDGLPVYDTVYPDLCVVEARASRPTQPLKVMDAVWSTDVAGVTGTARWIWRVRSPEGSGYYEVSTDDSMPDMSKRVQTQIPVADDRVPVVYRAQITSAYWDPYEMRELVSGTIELGIKYSFLSHIHLQASWSQRYAVDLDVLGQEVVTDSDGTRVRGVTTDPATVVQLRSRDDGRGQPQIGSWQLPVTVTDYHESVIQYEKRLASMAGLQTADLLRESGDPRSGYALAVSREAVIRHQRKYSPVYAAADARLLGLIARVWNAHNPGMQLPETGWRVKHRGVPMTAGEIQQYVATVLEMMGRGLVTPEWALSRILSVTEGDPEIREQAMGSLDEAMAQAAPEPAAESADPAAEPGSAPADDAPAPQPGGQDQAVETESVAASNVEPLNGAQVTSALDIIDRVGRRQLPRDSGIAAMVDFYGIPRERAEAIMGPVGATFFIEEPQQGDTDGRQRRDPDGGDDPAGEVPAGGQRAQRPSREGDGPGDEGG